MTVKIHLDFDKKTLSRGVIDLLQNALTEDPEQTLSKLPLKDCLSVILRGNKLQYAPANYLIRGLLCALLIEGSPIEDETDLSRTQEEKDLGKDLSLSQHLREGTSKEAPDDKDDKKESTDPSDAKTPSTDHNPNPKSNKKRETCRFYARGHCTRNKDCRFDHPNICKKFRQFGSKSTDSKGCDGKCNAFHPNACRSSLQSRSCSWTDCRFFHLKGTKRTSFNANTNSHPNTKGSQNQNWRSNQQSRQQTQPNDRSPHNGNSRNRKQNNDQSRSHSESKNRKRQNQNKNPDPTPKQTTREETVTKEEKVKLGQTLEAIMNRLTAMENRQTVYPNPGMHLHPQIQPLLSPAVPQPGTQTQFQWGSPNQWTQSQC